MQLEVFPHVFLVLYGILLTKLFWPNVRKNCSSDQEKLLKFEVSKSKRLEQL